MVERYDIATGLWDFTVEHNWKLVVVFGIVLLVVPAAGLTSYATTILSQMVFFAVLALSWDLIGGQTGYPSFGNMAFFGIGGYTTAVLVKTFGLGFYVSIAAGGGLAVLLALPIGLVVFRLREEYFAIATLGVLLILQQVARNLEITGKATGIIMFDTPSNLVLYYLFAGILLVEIIFALYLRGAQYGSVLNAIRDDEHKAESLGINAASYKNSIWLFSALFTGLVGGVWALYNSTINPPTGFNLTWNVELITMALIGGTGTIAGPVLGAFGLTLLITYIDTAFPAWRLVILGALIMLVVIAFPNGIVGTVERYTYEQEYRGGDAPDVDES